MPKLLKLRLKFPELNPVWLAALMMFQLVVLPLQFVALPKTDEARVLGKQVLRSGTSVGANYREAHRSRSKAEFISKLGDCLKELDETAYWLELLTESDIVPPIKLTSLQDETNQLLAILTTISKKTKEGL
jgi:four helix bundle protein